MKRKTFLFIAGPILAAFTSIFGFFIPVLPDWLLIACIVISFGASIIYSKQVSKELRE